MVNNPKLKINSPSNLKIFCDFFAICRKNFNFTQKFKMRKQKLIEARKRKNLSQESIANALHIDVSNYNRREKGEIKITTEQWQKLSKVLKRL